MIWCDAQKSDDCRIYSKVFDFFFHMLHRTNDWYIKHLSPFIEIWCCEKNSWVLFEFIFKPFLLYHSLTVCILLQTIQPKKYLRKTTKLRNDFNMLLILINYKVIRYHSSQSKGSTNWLRKTNSTFSILLYSQTSYYSNNSTLANKYTCHGSYWYQPIYSALL